MAKLRAAGVTDVHQVPLDLPAQRDVRSWSVSVTGNGQTMPLESSVAARGAPGTNGATLDVEAVWVGLGSEADFAGCDVKGKAVFIYSEVSGTVLPAGTHVSKLANTGLRTVVEVLNTNENHIYTTVIGVPNEALKPTVKARIGLEEPPAGAPEALRDWFYPGALHGVAFPPR